MSIFFPRSITVLRETTGSYVSGKWTRGTRDTITINARARHFEAHELNALPSGKAGVGHIKIYSNNELRLASEGLTTSGDIVQWDGKYWEVIQQLHRDMGIIGHYKYAAEFRTAAQIGL